MSRRWKGTGPLLLVKGASTPLSAEAKLELIRRRIKELMTHRLALLRAEATTLVADMECLTSRIDASGHHVAVDDLRSARWYRTAGDVRLLQQLYRIICETMEVPNEPLFVPVEEPPDEIEDEDKVVE